MAYTSIYRRYRPMTFDEVVGQKYIIQTLRNSINNKKEGHAYIFTGPRGVGKTSIARIIAKAVNCLNKDNANPCNECEICKAINEQSAIDVIEIDAASNNGVEEMRALLEKVNFLPAVLSKKIYIIDEVHMLSTSAFNALLKTLEEPPAHVIFILATTEPYKVPATILSRCQRFDFKPLTVSEICEQLTKIAYDENINITDEGKLQIAYAAEGGLRDALSILDQVAAFSSGEINEEVVNKVTGRVSRTTVMKLFNYILDNDTTNALKYLDEILYTGIEINTLVQSMLNISRDIILYKSTNESVDKTDIFKNIVSKAKRTKIFQIVDVLNDIQNKIRYANTPKMHLEIGVVKMTTKETALSANTNDVDLTDLYEKLDALDLKIKHINITKEDNTLNEFKDFTKSKLEFLEEVLSKCAVQPKGLEERIEALEEQSEQEIKPSYNVDLSNIENRLENLEKTTTLEYDKSVLEKINEELNGLKEKINTSSEVDILNEVDKKYKDVLLQLEAYQNTNIGFSDNTELINKVNKLENLINNQTNIEERIHEVETLIKNKANESTTNNIMDNTDVDELLNKVNALENKLNEFNKPVDLDSLEQHIYELEYKLTNELNELASKSTNIDTNTIDALEKKIQEVKDYAIKVGTRCTTLEEQLKSSKADIFKQTIQKRVQPYETPLREEQQVLEQTITPEVTPEKPVLPEGQTDDTDKVYDIKVIENILHQSRDKRNIEDKERINAVWYRLASLVPQNISGVAQTLSEGKVVVNGGNCLIIVYQQASVCNYLMSNQAHFDGKEVLRLTLKKDYDFIALPFNTWHEKSNEYKGQYHMGITYPKLTPINNKELRVINVNKQAFQTKATKTLDQATQMFGKSLIREVK